MSCIYIIRCKDLNVQDCYIGSCTDIRRRKNEHKFHCNNKNSPKYNYKLYQFIRANGGFDNFEMVEICKCDIDTLREMEQYHIDFIKPSLNSQRAYNSEEFTKDYRQNWAKNNRDRINKLGRKYYANNREKNVQRVKDYYKMNKDEYNKRRAEKITCGCGSIYSKSGRSYHLKTIKHQNYIQSLSSSES